MNSQPAARLFLKFRPASWLAALLGLGMLLSFFAPCEAKTVLDQRGRSVSVEKPFARIISLYGAHTENLYALGADHQLIGVSVNETYPPKAREKDQFSYHDGLEKFLAARPDLVLIRPMIDNGYPQFVRQLESHGITVVSLQPSGIAAMYDYWRTLGILTGKEKQAQDLIHGFQEAVDAIHAVTRTITPKKQVYFQAIHAKMRTFTPGAMPLFALDIAGGINVAADAKASRNTNVAIYGKEQILSKAQMIDVIIAQQGVMNPVQKSDILNEPGFHVIKAVKEGQVYLIDENIVARPVPRLYNGILAIGHLLYPKIFTQLTFKKDLI